MPSARSRLRSRQQHTHHWTTFEQHALLCLICRQIPITGLPGTSTSTASTTSPSRAPFPKGAKRNNKKPSAAATGKASEFARSIRHAHRDVADALNRALNFANHERDIPVEEVSAMIDRLMEERRGAVKFLERQRTCRVTRVMKRVWERAGMASCRGGIVVRDSMTGAVTDHGGDRAQVHESANVDVDEDPWGDNGATSLIETQPDPWGEEVAAYLSETQQDPWGDGEVTGPAVESQDAVEARSPVQGEATMIDAEDERDPWGSHTAPTYNSDSFDPWGSNNAPTQDSDPSDPWGSHTAPTQSSDPADPWGDTATPSTVNGHHSKDPWTDPPSQLERPSTPNIISSHKPQPTTSASTCPTTTSRDQEFTGMNSARLAMIESTAAFQDVNEHVVNAPSLMGKGKGGNAVQLPFNRIAAATTMTTNDSKKNAATVNEIALDDHARRIDHESDVSEEE